LKTPRDKKKMLNAIRTKLNENLVNAPMDDKNGWKLQNFHDMLHIVMDIEKLKVQRM